jgi:hypothetical protein
MVSRLPQVRNRVKKATPMDRTPESVPLRCSLSLARPAGEGVRKASAEFRKTLVAGGEPRSLALHTESGSTA